MKLQKTHLRPSVYEYSDYRLFLEDLYRHLKSKHRYFSFRYFSRRARFRSPNFLKLVIQGKRNLSLESISRFSEALGMARAESEFFGVLVRFNQSVTADEKADCAKKLLLFRGLQKAKPLQQAEFAYYANWHYIAVREAAALKDFDEDPAWVAERIFPRVSIDEARAALRDLQLLGLLVRDENGRLHQAERTLTTSNEVTSSAIARYHKAMLEKASLAIDEVPRERREFSAACVPVSFETATKIKILIQNFRNEILTLAAEDSTPDVIYQMNIQLFPMSVWETEEKSSR